MTAKVTASANMTTYTARAISAAYKNSSDELTAQLANLNIVQHPETEARRWIELDNHYFNLVVEYQNIFTSKSYLSLCNKIEILVGKRFTYRP